MLLSLLKRTEQYLTTKNCLDENVNSAKAKNPCPKHIKVTLVYTFCKIHNSNCSPQEHGEEKRT